MNIVHDKNCDVKNIKTGVVASADVVSFVVEEKVVVSIRGSLRIQMIWNEKAGQYIGSAVGMEFETAGPKYHTVRKHR